MAPDERGRAAGATPDDKHDNDDAAHATPREPPPPSVLDLGGGQAWCIGTAADFRAAAAWLHRNYPEHSQDPPRGHTGPIYAMMIHHSRPASDFATLPNETLRDERLSIAARGHLAYLLSLPDGWNTTADAEANRARALRGKRGEGRAAMRAIYAELKNAGYIRYDRTQANGKWSTEIHVFDRPRTDVPRTDVPETRTSVPPAETPEPVDNPPDTFSQVAPTYASPGVGPPDVGSPVHRWAVHSYEDWVTEDGERTGVGDAVDDWGARGNHPREEQPIANSQASSRWTGNDGPDDQQIPLPVTHQGPATDRNARASEPNGLATRRDADVSQPEGKPGADAPCPNPPPAAPDATRRPSGWRSQQQIAADQAAESRASREAAERAAAVTP